MLRFFIHFLFHSEKNYLNAWVEISESDFFPSKNAGGPVRSLMNLTSQLKMFDFYVFTRSKDLNDSVIFQNINENNWNKTEYGNVFYSDELGITKKIYKIVKEINPSIIYLNSFWSFNFSIKILILKYLNLIGNSELLLAPRGELFKEAMKIKPIKKSIYLL